METKKKGIKIPVTKREAAWIKGKATILKKKIVLAEVWAHPFLKQTRLKWTRQSVWGYRIFDFWCHEKGIAVEIDGLTHDKDYDA